MCPGGTQRIVSLLTFDAMFISDAFSHSGIWMKPASGNKLFLHLVAAAIFDSSRDIKSSAEFLNKVHAT